MPRIKKSTIPEQAAAHLRDGIASGRWIDELPGRGELVADLGVSPRSIQQAMKILEKEGLLVPRGQGRRHQIQVPEKGFEAKPIRVAVLLYRSTDRNDNDVVELRNQINEAGHISILPPEGLQDLGMNLKRVARLVRNTTAEAWVLHSASREILQWFVDQDIKVFALAGRRFKFPIAGTGPDKAPLMGEVTQKLIDLGHSRIVVICNRSFLIPEPSRSHRVFLDTMKAAGIPTGDYNLPDWENSKEGFKNLLDSLFQKNPPTALILDEAFRFHGAYHYLAQHNLRVPHDVSLVCTDWDPGFMWCKPSVAHIHWDYHPVVRRIVRWVDNVARGVEDKRQSFTKAKYIDGGTVGPVPDL